MYGTDPLDVDTDDDGLTDYEEWENYFTDPLDDDTDDDGLKDGVEIQEYLTDPLNDDTDGDGLLDGEEINIYFTNPRLRDTDSDEIDDDLELALGTDPNLSDTDGDGLLDGEEVLGITYWGWYIKYSDPLSTDTDDDGMFDDEDIAPYGNLVIKMDFVEWEVSGDPDWLNTVDPYIKVITEGFSGPYYSDIWDETDYWSGSLVVEFDISDHIIEQNFTVEMYDEDGTFTYYDDDYNDQLDVDGSENDDKALNFRFALWNQWTTLTVNGDIFDDGVNEENRYSVVYLIADGDGDDTGDYDTILKFYVWWEIEDISSGTE